MEKYYTIGALVGLFQVHELHEAHHYVINQVVENHKKVILFLGVPKVVGTKNNPLDFVCVIPFIFSEFLSYGSV